jgi:hypothetical protein
VSVAYENIVALEQCNYDAERRCWRTKIHLRGGSHLIVDEDFDYIESLLEKLRPVRGFS